MKKLLLTLALLFPTSAWAQCTGVFPPNTVCGNFTASPAPPAPQVGVTGSVSVGTAGQVAWYPSNGAAVAGTSLGAIPYLITGGTTTRNDATRWTDNGVSAADIGVDCTGVADSTTAIQTFVNANLTGGHLVFPANCAFFTTATITLTDAINFTFSSASTPGSGGGTATWNWKGGNGGTGCHNGTATCIFVIDFEHSDHPTVQNINFSSSHNLNGWIGDTGCPDGYIKFDGNPGVHIGTAGHILSTTFSNGACNNPNFIAVSISPTATQNHENYTLLENAVVCGTQGASFRGTNAVTNGTTTLTDATDHPFVSGDVGRRIRIAYGNPAKEFDTTISAFNSSSNVTLASAVPFSQTGVTIITDSSVGFGVRNGASQNALQQVVWKLNYTTCEIGTWQQGGNMAVYQATGGQSDIGNFVGGFSAQQALIDYPAAEGNVVDEFIQGSVAPSNISHARWSNGQPIPTGYVVLGGSVRVTEGFSDFTPASPDAQLYSTVYTYAVQTIGTIVGGSAYTNGTYTNVPLLISQGVAPAVGLQAPASGVGVDVGIKGTVVVAGGVVTTVTITTAGSFLRWPFPINGHIALYSLTATPANIGGTGTGFTVPITGLSAVFVGTGGGSLVFLDNIYRYPFAQMGFSSFGNNNTFVAFGDAWGDGLASASNVIACSQEAACTQSTANLGTGINQKAVFNSLIPGVGSGPATNYQSSGTFSGGTTFTGFQAKPSTGRLSSYQVGFENAAVVVDTTSLLANYGFIARSMTSYGGSIPNVYGFYAEAQKITNVTIGYGFYSAGVNDLNFFAGPVITAPTVVGSLPTCNSGTQGARMFVTDQATAIAYHGAVTGSGAFKQGVTCDGTAWYQD